MRVYRVKVQVRRAKQVLQTEGLIPLLRQGFAFLAASFLQCGTYYLYEHTVTERNEADFMPKIQNFTFKTVSTNQQADELVAGGFELGSQITMMRRRLDRGAIAFCIFIERELAHIGWVALTEEAKELVDAFPYKVDFSNGEACTGGTWTDPKYRGTGLMVYGYFKRFQFLKERGKLISRNVVATSNVASQRGHAYFGPKICGEARYLKLLWWKCWREKPLP